MLLRKHFLSMLLSIVTDFASERASSGHVSSADNLSLPSSATRSCRAVTWHMVSNFKLTQQTATGAKSGPQDASLSAVDRPPLDHPYINLPQSCPSHTVAFRRRLSKLATSQLLEVAGFRRLRHPPPTRPIRTSQGPRSCCHHTRTCTDAVPRLTVLRQTSEEEDQYLLKQRPYAIGQ